MSRTTGPGTMAYVARGMVAGVGGTVLMTAFQKLVEMPVTKRADSYVPADIAERLLPVHPTTPAGRTRLNYASHLSLGGMWGAAYGVAASRGLRGQRAVHAVFAVMYANDLVMSALTGVSNPVHWSARGWAVDVVDKYVQAQGTGLVFDRLLDPARR